MHAQCTMYNKHGLPRHTPPPSPHGGVAQEREEGRGREREKGSCSLPLHVEASATTRGKSFFAATVASAQSEQEREAVCKRISLCEQISNL